MINALLVSTWYFIETECGVGIGLLKALIQGRAYIQETRYLSKLHITYSCTFQLTDNFSDRAQSSKAMLKWSGTGSLPLIAGNEELLVPRRNSEVSQYILGTKKFLESHFLKLLLGYLY